jgi:hypothetical protein
MNWVCLPCILYDAVELAAAGINAFAHLVRDKEMNDELIASMLVARAAPDG